MTANTLDQWQRGNITTLDRDQVLRLSYIFGTDKALQILFSTTEGAARWIHAPNDARLFGGRMLAGQMNDLHVVRQYLDEQRGGKA